MVKTISEILNEAAKMETFDASVQHLVKNDSFPLRTVLQGSFHPNIVFELPETDPPYSQNDPIAVEGRFYGYAKKLDLFVRGGRPVSSQTKREMLFIEMLESIHPQDAAMVLRMVKKKEPVPGITAKMARAAFPGLLPDAVDEPEVSESESAPKKTTRRRTKKTAE